MQRAVVAHSAICLDDALVGADVALRKGREWLVLSEVDLPFNLFVAPHTELVQWRVHDFLRLYGVLVVLEFEDVLILLSALPRVALLRRHCFYLIYSLNS